MIYTDDYISLNYTNYRGELSSRQIRPEKLYFGSTEYHPEPQWLLEAHDLGKGAKRVFALKDCDFTTPPKEGE